MSWVTLFSSCIDRIVSFKHLHILPLRNTCNVHFSGPYCAFHVFSHWTPCFLNHHPGLVWYWKEKIGVYPCAKIFISSRSSYSLASWAHINTPGWPSMLSILYSSLVTFTLSHRFCLCQDIGKAVGQQQTSSTCCSVSWHVNLHAILWEFMSISCTNHHISSYYTGISDLTNGYLCFLHKLPFYIWACSTYF